MSKSQRTNRGSKKQALLTPHPLDHSALLERIAEVAVLIGLVSHLYLFSGKGIRMA